MARHWTLSKQREPESHWHMRIAPTMTATVAPMLRINSSLASRPPTTAARVSSAPAATALHFNEVHDENEPAQQPVAPRTDHPVSSHGWIGSLICPNRRRSRAKAL